jgi:hypothetical protein
MTKKFYNLDKYKTEISLPDFLREVYGWTVEEGSTNKQPKLKSPAGDVQLVIKMNQKGHYTCWNTYESDPFFNQDKRVQLDEKKLKPGSSIIDVVQWEHQKRTGKLLTIPEVAEFLEDFLKNENLISQNSSFKLERELITNEIEFTKLRTESLPLTETGYLESRGIIPEVLKEKVWDGVFCNVKFYSAAQRITFINTATRLVNATGIVGMSIRTNDGQKRIEGRRLDSLSSSRFDKTRPVDKLHVFESMIDAVSYYQLYYYLKNTTKNVQLISTEGAMTAPQLNTIQEVIHRNKVKQIELNLDNDIAGIMYTANIVGNLTHPEQKDNTLEYCRISKTEVNEDKIFCFDAKFKIDNQQDLKQKLDQYFPENVFNKYISPESWSIAYIDGVEGAFRIMFPEQKEILFEITENITSLRFGNIVEINLPKDKDYNLDLTNDKLNKENNNQLIL